MVEDGRSLAHKQAIKHDVEDVGQTRAHFNPAMALSRLLAGEPPQHVFGPQFGWPVTPLSENDLATPYHSSFGGHKKAIKSTILLARTGDVAHELLRTPISSTPARQSFSSETLVTPKLVRGLYKPELTDVLHTTKDIVSKNVDNDSLLERAIISCGTLLPKQKEQVATIINNTIKRNILPVGTLGSAYFELLRSVYARNIGNNPTVESFSDLLTTSYAVLGRPASHDIHYSGEYQNHVRPYAVVEATAPFNVDLFELVERLDGRLMVALKGSARRAIERDYVKVLHESGEENLDIETGCPANLAVSDPQHPRSDANEKYSLIEVMLHRLRDTILHKSEPYTA